MTTQRELLQTHLGFRFGINGPHAARTMMLEDLLLLLAHTEPTSDRGTYTAAVVADNVLGKPTRKARELALRHLVTLYGLDLQNPLFRVLRRLWSGDSVAQPMLALAVALARDPLLRATQPFFLTRQPGSAVRREEVEAFLNAAFPERFSAASLKSFAQNVAGTWTSAGILEGRSRKFRATPPATPEAVAMLLFMGYLDGRTGQRLFTSDWMTLLGRDLAELEVLASAASHRGLLVFMNAGGVKETRFPGYLTAEEEQVRQEIAHVL